MKRSFSIAVALVVLAVAGVSAETSTTTLTSPVKEKRFWRATGEMIVIGYSPWVWSHYVMDFEYANISWETVDRNISNPPWWDADSFRTNMWGHPAQGSLYYNAARENGFNFWESAPFVAVGSFGWEYLMESEPPSYNDMSNTFFGGVARGEMSHRLSVAIRDNRAHGWEKFWRELGAGILNPVGFLDRAVFGDMWKEADNPRDRNPSRLHLTVDGGYMRGREQSAYPDQGMVDLTLRHNDPHEYPVRKPFDYFDMEGTIAISRGPLIPGFAYRGLLAGWNIKEEADVHHMLAPALVFNYFDNGPSSFGGSALGLTLLSRWKLGNDFDLRTEVGGQGYIAAAMHTDYDEVNVAANGRSYDFGSGGGPKVDVRIRRNEVDWFRMSVAAGWFPTHDGLSTQSRIFLVNTEARYPLTETVALGAGWSLQDRETLYDELPKTNITNSTIKAFVSWAFRIL